MSTRAAIASFVLTLGFAVGCGSDDASDDPSSGGETTSQKETAPSTDSFDESAEKICSRFQEEALATLKPLNRKLEQQNISPQEFARDKKLLNSTTQLIESQLLPAYEQFIQDAGELEPPSEDADGFNAVLQAYETAYDDYRANPLSVIDPDADAAIEQAEEESGFTLCAI
ncbi:hypothetical protein HJD18_03385 [Thermoleophilia bacterium SCSIO 60948]|nr:hypothetical protein HJD18_03385 [Thermoleophilia bacterium SCSIO 60948]